MPNILAIQKIMYSFAEIINDFWLELFYGMFPVQLLRFTGKVSDAPPFRTCFKLRIEFYYLPDF